MAPSIHNTQPWRSTATPDRLDVFTDPGRALRVLDPSGRQMERAAVLSQAVPAERIDGLQGGRA